MRLVQCWLGGTFNGNGRGALSLSLSLSLSGLPRRAGLPRLIHEVHEYCIEDENVMVVVVVCVVNNLYFTQ